MRNFSMEDYNLFTEGGNKVTSNTQSLIENMNSADKYAKELCSEDIFAGPIANDFAQKFNTINSTIIKSAGELLRAELYLNRAFFNYKASDNTNTKKIGGV